MARTDGNLIVTTRDTDKLLASVGLHRSGLDSALGRGVVVRVKVSSQWLYALNDEALSSGENAVIDQAENLLKNWFVGNNAWLGPTVAKRLRAPRVTGDAAELLLRSAFRNGRFLGLGLISERYLPYLAVYRAEEQVAVENALRDVRVRLERAGIVRPHEIDDGGRRTTVDGWRGLLLRHAEYLGFGYVDDGALVAWGRHT